MNVTATGKPLTPELQAWEKARLSLLEIAHTTVTPSGHTIDWVPIASQTKHKIATPPPAEGAAVASDPKRPAKAIAFEKIEAGPAGHVPILRPDLTKLPARKLALDERFAKRGGLFVNKKQSTAAPTDPNPAGYFHCSTGQTVTSYGCDGWLNVWDPLVDIPSSPGDDHSISQTWLQNYQTGTTQSIEAGLTVDHSLNGDAANHLFTYYTTNGYASDGNNRGGYNRLYSGWVQYDPSIFPGIRVNGASTFGGTQLELGIKFQLFQGNWWFGIKNSASWTWIGYYPASLFGGHGISNHAEWASFGGEVYSALSNPCSTTDQMGSGRKADAGWSYAAYQRNLRYQSGTGGVMSDFDGAAETDTAASGCPANSYTIAASMVTGSSWGSYQFWGGPSEGWESLHGVILGTIKPVSWAANRLDLFVRGTDNAVWHKWWDGSNWGPSITNWESLGGGIVGAVAGGAWSANRLDLFVRGTDNAVWHKWWDGSHWGPSVTNWESLGGQVTSDPTSVSWGANRLDVFARGTDGGVWHKWWDGSHWGPSPTGWESLGGGILGGVKAVAWGPNRLDLFVRGTDDAVWHKWWDGSHWGPSITGWESLGGQILGDVEAVSWGPNRLDLFVRGTDHAMWHKWWDGSHWGPSVANWESLGGVIVTDPTAISWGPNRLDAFAEGTDSAVWHKWWDGSHWGPSVTNWESLGGRITARQSGVAWAANRLDLFVRGTDNAVWHRWWNGHNWLPS